MSETIEFIPHSVNRKEEGSKTICSVNIDVSDIKAQGFHELPSLESLESMIFNSGVVPGREECLVLANAIHWNISNPPKYTQMIDGEFIKPDPIIES